MEPDKEQPIDIPKPDDVITPSSADAGSQEAPQNTPIDTGPVLGDSSHTELSVEDDATPAADSTSTDMPPPQPVVSSTGGKKKKLIIISIIVLLLLAGAGAYWWFTQRDDTPTAPAPAASNEEQKQDVALIRYGVGEGVMNSFAPQNNPDTVTALINRQIFEPLVEIQDNTKIVPVLAKSWTNPDEKTWIFNLDTSVKFHTGNTLSAKDVVYSYEQMKKNPDSSYLVTETIKSVEAIGDNQVKITTKEVDPILLNRLVNLFIVDSSSKGKAPDPKYGTGPYEVKAGTKPTAGNIDLVAVDNYHGGHVYTRELQVKVYTEDEKNPGSSEKAMTADIKAGKLDIAGFITGDNLQAAKDAGFQLYQTNEIDVYQLVLNTNKKTSPLSNLKVRQAIYKTIDVDALLKAIGRTGKPAGQLVPEFIPGYNPAITRPATDITGAKKLMKEAGYADGTSFTLTVFAPVVDAGNEIARQLKTIGITVKVQPIADVDTLQSGVVSGAFDAYYFANGSSYGDAADVLSYAAQSSYYSNDKAVTLLTTANSTLDQNKRLSDLQQASKLIMDDVAVAPLYINEPAWAVTKPYIMTQDYNGGDLGVYFYKVYLAN